MHFRKRYKTYDEAVERANQIYETYFGDFKYKDKPKKICRNSLTYQKLSDII